MLNWRYAGTNAPGLVLPIVLVLIGAGTGCATGGTMQSGWQGPQAVVFENNSPDVVRVSLYGKDHELVLGRVAPFERAVLPLRPRLLPPESDAMCLIVVPVGAPSVSKPGPLNAGAIRSEFYPVSELTRQLWTYSGSGVMVAKLPSGRP